jgi:anti-sigma factor RsiW
MVDEDHRRYEEDLAAYLLDALEPDEVRSFRAHLEGCARCQTDERWLRSAVELLPSSVEQFEPSRQLRGRLLARVNIEAENDLVPEREEPPRRRRWAFGLRPATALATLAVVAVAGAAGYLIGQGEEANVTATTIQAQATPEQPDALANVVRTGDSAVLNVQRLPALHRGRIYQTWLQRGKKIEPSTLFVVGKNGMGSAGVTGSLDGVAAVMVSEEPAGGSPQPTSKPVLIAKL